MVLQTTSAIKNPVKQPFIMGPLLKMAIKTAFTIKQQLRTPENGYTNRHSNPIIGYSDKTVHVSIIQSGSPRQLPGVRPFSGPTGRSIGRDEICQAVARKLSVSESNHVSAALTDGYMDTYFVGSLNYPFFVEKYFVQTSGKSDLRF